MRKSLFAAALSLLMLPAATAFAEGEGSFQPASVASPASGAGGYAAVGASFDYNQGEGGQSVAMPHSGTGRSAARTGLPAGAFVFNTGSNG